MNAPYKFVNVFLGKEHKKPLTDL
ncbi:hypothetical protein T190820D02B_100085 [Tenacibaculum sp. 190524A05c]